MFSSRRSLLRVLEREREAFAAERRLMLDTICRLAGRPQAPSDLDVWRAQHEPVDRDADDLMYDPDQLPV